mgnify:FL=1
MSVTSWDVMMERLYQNCMDSPKDAEEFCIGCPHIRHYPATLVTPAENVCEWDFNPSECPRAGEWRDSS